MLDIKKFKPLGNQILVEELKKENKIAGLLLPEDYSENAGIREGKIVAIGKGLILSDGKRQEMDVSLGKLVLFEWGKEIKIENKSYFIMSESNVLAIIN